jgi:hypothetical protein
MQRNPELGTQMYQSGALEPANKASQTHASHKGQYFDSHVLHEVSLHLRCA